MDTQAKERKKSYSDLEAIVIPSSSFSSSSSPPQHQHQPSASQTFPGGRTSYWNEKFLAEPSSDPEPALPNNNNNHARSTSIEKKGVYGGGNNGDFSASSPVDTLPPPPPAYYLVDSKGQTQALYAVPTNNSTGSSDTDSIVNFKDMEGGGGYNAATPPAPVGWWKSMGQGRRILGLRKNVFLAACAGLCVLILGLLLTVILVTRHNGGNDGNDGTGRPNPADNNGPPTFSTPVLLARKDAGAMLSGTNLASINWTDLATGTAYTGVFYQSSRATGMALMAAIKNEAAGTWQSVNISASAQGTSATKTPLDVLPGTPLAAATNNGLWNLVYLTSDFGLQEVYATDPASATGWAKGEMAARLGNPTAVPGSSLGALWQSCAACDNALFVTWQDGASMRIVYANMTNLTWGDTATVSETGAPGSRVAVSAFTDYDGTGDTGADKNAVRFYFEEGEGLFEAMKGPLGGGKLIAGNFGECEFHTRGRGGGCSRHSLFLFGTASLTLT